MLTKIHTEFYSRRSFDFFPLEFIVQIYELKQKASIDLYRPFLSDVFQSCQSIPVVAYHQVNDYKCRGSGFAKDAVDEYFAFLLNRVIHEFRSVRKMPKEEKMISYASDLRSLFVIVFENFLNDFQHRDLC